VDLALRPALARRPARRNEVYHARFEQPLLESGADQRTAMEQASRLSGD
jgi:hypothetical protein